MLKTIVIVTMTPLLSYAGMIVSAGTGNDGRQCPESPILMPIALLDRAAPQSSFCFSYPPPLVGYLDPNNTARTIVWTTFIDSGPAALTLEGVVYTVPAVSNGSPPSGPGRPLYPTPPEVLQPTPDPPQIAPPGAANVPEPATWLTIGAGLLGILAWRRPRPKFISSPT